MLLILSKDSPSDVLKALQPVLKDYQNTDYRIVQGPVFMTGNATAILGLGTHVLDALQSAGAAPKNRTVTSLRRSVLQFMGLKTLVSYSSGIAEVDYKQYVDLLTDVSLALRLAKTGTITPQYGDYQYVTDYKQMVAEIKATLDTDPTAMVDSAFDTETLGLDRFHPDGYLIALQFSHKPGTAQVVAFPNKAQSMKWLLDHDNQMDLRFLLNHARIRTVAANGKYDLEWLYEQAGITCTNFRFDTMLVGSLLDENRSNGLDVHAKVYVPHMAGYSDEFDQKADKSRMDLEYAKDPEKFLLYSGGDADATLQVKIAQKADLLADPLLTSFYVNILHPAARAFEHVERGGVVIDMEAYKELESDLRKEMAGLVGEAKKHLGGLLVAKHRDDTKVEGLNITKASLLIDYLFSPAGLNLKPKLMTAGGKNKDPQPSTAMDHLEQFIDHPEAGPFVKLLSGFGSAQKMLSTYVTGFQKHIRSDGRYHPTYFLFAGNKEEGDGGTNTGRPSVRDPAFQTIPKHNKWAKAIRRCYPAPQGYLILETDYSQGELRVVACVANEQTMLGSYSQGMDLHVVTGGSIGGYTYEEMLAMKVSNPELFDQLRQQAKAGNFGLLYGMGVDGFMEYARLNYGVTLTYAQAEEIRANFFRTYPGLVAYHEAYKAHAHKHGFVRSPLGRVRHLPLINSSRKDVRASYERKSINSPIQGALSDMMIWSVAIETEMGWHEQAPCFGTVHDASYRYIPEDNYEFYAKRTVEVMENLPFEKVGWAPQLKFIADAKVGHNMGDLKDLKKFASSLTPATA